MGCCSSSETVAKQPVLSEQEKARRKFQEWYLQRRLRVLAPAAAATPPSKEATASTNVDHLRKALTDLFPDMEKALYGQEIVRAAIGGIGAFPKTTGANGGELNPLGGTAPHGEDGAFSPREGVTTTAAEPSPRPAAISVGDRHARLQETADDVLVALFGTGTTLAPTASYDDVGGAFTEEDREVLAALHAAAQSYYSQPQFIVREVQLDSGHKVRSQISIICLNSNQGMQRQLPEIQEEYVVLDDFVIIESRTKPDQVIAGIGLVPSSRWVQRLHPSVETIAGWIKS